MASLSIRNLNEDAYERLRVRAASHGVSMEEEVRQILYQTVAAPPLLSTLFKKYFGTKNGIDLGKINQRKPHHPMDFDE